MKTEYFESFGERLVPEAVAEPNESMNGLNSVRCLLFCEFSENSCFFWKLARV